MVRFAPVEGPLGAVVTDVDLRAPLSHHDATQIRRAWLQHLVLVFADQDVTDEQYLQFARSLGVPGAYPFLSGRPGYPEIVEVVKQPDETENFGGAWHSDTTYQQRPPMASMLLARVVPPVGGDTEFANMYAAWDELPTELRDAVRGRTAHNWSGKAASVRTKTDQLDETGDTPSLRSEHPAVRTHPETGRRALYLSRIHTERFSGLSPDETDALLERLHEHQTSDRFVWRLQWKPNMIALWDNRCVMHNPLNDYDGHLRLMHRITLQGDIPI